VIITAAKMAVKACFHLFIDSPFKIRAKFKARPRWEEGVLQRPGETGNDFP
jgi:hypothetical protein